MGKRHTGRAASLVRRITHRPERLPREELSRFGTTLHEQVEQLGEPKHLWASNRRSEPKSERFFTYDHTVTKAEASCKLCSYVPKYNVDNPKACLRSHERKVHRIYKKPYVIQEEP